MAGHSHAKNVKRRKDAQNAKKSLSFSKLSHAVYLAALGGADQEKNYQLKIAVKKASQGSLPKERIENAINRAQGGGEAKAMSQIRYNATVGDVIFIIEVLTDNKNRSISNIKNIFTKNGGSLSDSNSLEFMFDQIGTLEYSKSDDNNYRKDDIEMAALETDAQNVTENESSFIIETLPSHLHQTLSSISDEFKTPSSMSLTWKAKNPIEIINEEKADKIRNICDLLDSDDDVSNFYHNIIKL